MRSSIIAFILSFLFYIIDFFFLDGALFYIISGLVGGSIYELIGDTAGVMLISLLWLLPIIVAIVIVKRTSNGIIRAILLIVIALLLYLVDFISSDLVILETAFQTIFTNVTIALIKALIIGVIVFRKSGVVSK